LRTIVKNKPSLSHSLQESCSNEIYIDSRSGSGNSKYISHVNDSSHRGKQDLFNYESLKQSKSFNYSGKECPATPNKANVRAYKNMDLLSPVTRILGLDMNSLKVTCNLLKYRLCVN
jgi:hypothetical protein